MRIGMVSFVLFLAIVPAAAQTVGRLAGHR